MADGLYDDALDLPYDEDGRVDGYSFTGTRSRGLYEWKERKDEREFKKLCNRLGVRKWVREVYEEGGERLERLRANKRRHERKKARAAKADRDQRMRDNPRILTCYCGARWCEVPGDGRTRIYCSRRCQAKWPRWYAQTRKFPNADECPGCGAVWCRVPRAGQPLKWCGAAECDRVRANDANRRYRQRRKENARGA